MFPLALCVIPVCLMENTQVKTTVKNDREQILEHIHSIFQAYVKQDREAIRRTHAKDWVGFQGPSVKIERGIGDYMVNAEKSLQHLQGTGYELLDTEVQIHGDMALVYYIARYDYRDQEGNPGSIPLRSVDIYRREKDGWNQAGSHIGVIPQDASWRQDEHTAASKHQTEAPNELALASAGASGWEPRLPSAEREALLAAREAVWRAWFANDVAVLRDLVPEESIAIDPGVPSWADRDEILRRSAEFANGGGELIRLEFPETKMQVYGDVVILYTKFIFEAQRDGVRNVTTGRGTEVFVKRAGKWLNSGWHLEREP